MGSNPICTARKFIERMRTRSFRRNQDYNRKARAERLLRMIWKVQPEWIDARFIGMMARTPTPCSCAMCTHRDDRRQYVRSDISFREQLGEMAEGIGG